MTRVTGLLLVVGALSGCAATTGDDGKITNNYSPWLIKRELPQPAACTPLDKEQELALNLSRKMAESGRLHAALANAELLSNTLPEARLGKAKILRLLNRPEAEELYQSLLDTCLVAEGYHGMAQMAVAANRDEQALAYLQKAIALKPTNDAMRNDLGIVYLNLRKLDEARFELLTALELNESEQRAAGNLLTLLIYQDKLDQAGKLVSRYQLSTRQYKQAVARAKMLQQEDIVKRAAEGGVPANESETVAVAASEFSPPTTAARSITQQPADNNKGMSQPKGRQVREDTAASEGEVSTETAAIPRMPSGVQGVQRVRTASSRPIVPLVISNADTPRQGI
ncbi:tetratricopeptide repeat protein [Zobellella aerophila]|uniref:Tetratricopeptide repeat protein n=1 Tax=Zobellella aerophila TaxID=870480 RepID=A0ABP6VW01_9GAMM